MIIWGWGKTTKRIIGQVFQNTCSYCNTTTIWQLCIVRTWFTLFFIPIIPYRTKYCIACPNCGSYMELTKEKFEEVKLNLSGTTVSDEFKYAGKTETQINFLKQMEEAKSNQ